MTPIPKEKRKKHKKRLDTDAEKDIIGNTYLISTAK